MRWEEGEGGGEGGALLIRGKLNILGIATVEGINEHEPNKIGLNALSHTPTRGILNIASDLLKLLASALGL
ncbi:hypothetical protein PRIPAC_70799 [Pristionchus pacificus]|uniref:Uncharacterized protein n=1 Tax=Pristionchus pacificus TaxID=54126 RepID=A0A2A6C983_PRIPA|nr:hypothetical protein PRIPAC_70799 [Pristionchus pacificus]|eukprot:PDM74613.1 hypothetical protein PRIPAC_41969 [Pristionchus pacificus]